MNPFKKYSRITNRGISFDKLLAETSKLPSDMKTSEDPSDPLIQVVLSLSTNTIKEAFYHLSGKIGESSDQKK